MIDTHPHARDTAARTAFAATLLVLLVGPPVASARDREPRIMVVWVREERVYLAAADSGALEPGGRLTFLDRAKLVATGLVDRVYDRELALARLSSGSLSRVKRLERLRVLVEPPRLRALPLLRIGYPGRGRVNLLFACGEMAIDSMSSPRGYRTDAVSGHSIRLVRGPEAEAQAPWPDTLLIRLFDESADEEIALERDELDAGVFWPGELSAHMREEPRWQRPLVGVKSRGLLAVIASQPDGPGDSSAAGLDSLAFAALNRELFRGDLAPAGGRDALPAPSRRAATRYAVDPSCPGQRTLERVLNRAAPPPSARGDVSAVHLAYLDVPIGDASAIALGVAAYVKRGSFTPEQRAHADAMRWHPVFTLGCPLIGAPELRPSLEALGVDALVNLLACPGAGRAP